MNYRISGHIVDIVNQKIFKGVIKIKDGKILSVHESEEVDNQYITPGLIDAHIHIDSKAKWINIFDDLPQFAKDRDR